MASVFLSRAERLFLGPQVVGKKGLHLTMRVFSPCFGVEQAILAVFAKSVVVESYAIYHKF